MSAESPLLLTDIVDGDANLSLVDQYDQLRSLSLSLVEPLSYDDCQIQSMADAHSIKWHLAHTTWFFETFVLKKFSKEYVSYAPGFNQLFNSHFLLLGKRVHPERRGLLSRPSLKEILRYREYVDTQMRKLLDSASYESIEQLILQGFYHEQVHQERMLMDIKHAFFQNPLYPAYAPVSEPVEEHETTPLQWMAIDGGVINIGTDERAPVQDHERPQHQVYVESFTIASRLVSNADYLAFMNAGGYRSSQYWLDDGWQWCCEHDIHAPLYWVKQDGQWYEFTLTGLQPLSLEQPVCHISYFEAAAYAVWQNCRLVTEYEWELAALSSEDAAHYLHPSYLHPKPSNSEALTHCFGTAWEWTSSDYRPYPGFTPFSGDLTEYNAKFMSGRYVMRGGSCLTPNKHIRPTSRMAYRPTQRWQMSGIRLASDA